MVLRAFVTARGWQATEFVDHGVAGTKDRRPALDGPLAAIAEFERDTPALDRAVLQADVTSAELILGRLRDPVLRAVGAA